jgi:hypothetical protein
MKTLSVFVLVLLVSLLFVTCQDSANLVTTPEENVNGVTLLEKAIVTDVHEFFPLDTILSGECLGQDLHFLGGYDQYTHTVLDGNGGFHGKITWEFNNMTVTSTSSSDSWTPKYVDHAIIQGKVGEIFHESGHGFYKANQPGPDLREHWVLHMTVNANGEVTASKETIRMECFGH